MDDKRGQRSGSRVALGVRVVSGSDPNRRGGRGIPGGCRGREGAETTRQREREVSEGVGRAGRGNRGRGEERIAS